MKKSVFKKLIIILGFSLPIPILTTTKFPVHYIERLEHSTELDLKDDILDAVVKAYYENDISKENNINTAIGYFSKVLNSGCISITNEYKYNPKANIYNYDNDLDYNCIRGEGVCRCESLFLSKLLNMCRFDTSTLANTLHKSTDSSYAGPHSYVIIFDNKRKYIFDYTNNCYWKIDKLNNFIHARGNTTISSTPNPIASLIASLTFNYDDLVKFLTYDSDVDFDKVYNDYTNGELAFTEEDKLKIMNNTKYEKEKIKKIELNKN